MAIESPLDGDARMDMRALWLALRRRLVRVVLVTVLLFAAAYAALLFVPKSFQATSGILVENRDSVYTRPANDPAGASAPSADDLGALISSQMELVKSRDTLLDVVDAEKLTQVPEFNGSAKSPLGFLTRFFKKSSSASPEDVAVDALSSHLIVERDRDSSLINVTVTSSDPNLAATLANAVAKADVARRAGLSLSDTADASQWLDQQIGELRKRVSDAENKIANFKVSNDFYIGTNSNTLLDQQMTEISTQITAAQERRDTAASRAQLIRGLLSGGQPIDSVEDVRNSATIQQLEQQRGQLMTQRAQLLATLLPSHPSVQAVTAQVSAVDRQIGIEGRRVADALEAEAKVEDNLQNTLQTNLSSLKGKAADATRQMVTLDALNRDAKADRDLLESYLSRYRDATARTDTNADLPDVRVVTFAAAPNSPSSPKTTLILSAVVFVSLALQVGAIMFGELLSGRAIMEGGDNNGRRRPVGQGAAPAEAEAVGDGRALLQVEAPPAVAVAEEPARANHDEAVVEPATDMAASGRNLRSWFTRRARAVGASLSSFEPPLAAATSARSEPAMAEVEATKEKGQASVAAGMARDVHAVPSEPAEPDASREFSEVAPMDSPYPSSEQLDQLSADLVLGRTRIVLLAALDHHRDSKALSDRLIADVLRRGLSVARVDAGSGRPSTEPGVTDLSAERASFGDVVHKTAEEGFAEIPWGHLAAADRRSTRPLTLVEALSDIYEVVLVLTGTLGLGSNLPLFSGLPCRVLLVARDGSDRSRLEAAHDDLAALGFGPAEVIGAPLEAEVA
ncbi:MAG TPA: Wzz/FepE/Etk N-terminal domain-containing protein [Devosiaceae bacterium]|nr:Wzz/FepE/Etk N-terminal domain-containing protein [Devosiaceae bacterium]